MQTPDKSEDWKKVADLFWAKWNFPHCIGALDGKHITIYPPKNSGSLYYNYKGGFSIVLMALVDANYEFIYVDVGAEGHQADGGVWRKCSLKKEIDKNRTGLPQPSPLPGTNIISPYIIVADDAFPMGEHLLKPFRHRGLDDQEAIFNYRLSRARRVSENAFGIMANRFRCFLTKIQLDPDAATGVVLAATVLHNLLRRRCGVNYIPADAVDREDSDHYLIEGEWRRNAQLPQIYPAPGKRPSDIGKRIRLLLADYFLTKTGMVHWQQAAIE